MVFNADESAVTAAPRVSPASSDPVDRAGGAVRAGIADPVRLAELDRVAAAATAKITGENFPVALRLLPKPVREQLVCVYAFARFVDDVGDEAAGDRLALLAAVDADIDALSSGTARIEAVRALGQMVAKGAIDTQPLHDLVAANRHDQQVSSCETFDDLLDYCRLSAAPVGRMVLSVAGVDDRAAIERSDRVCAALQVLEHCQDVGEDAIAGRFYLPGEELRAAGVARADLLAGATSPALRGVIAAQVARADGMLADGRPLVGMLHGWARVAVSGYVAGGRATSSALRAARFDVLSSAVRPSKLLTLGHAAVLATGLAR